MALAAIYLSRVGVVGSVFAAALTVRTVIMSPAVAALNIGVGPCCGETCGDMLEAMARITPSQPNDAMARIASRRNRTILLDPNLPGIISERFFRDSLDVNLRFSSKKRCSQSVRSRNFTFSLQRFLLVSPCSAASF